MDIENEVIIGRKRIAHALGRSERTISRWIRRGILPTLKDGPFDNSLLAARAEDVEKIKRPKGPAS